MARTAQRALAFLLAIALFTGACDTEAPQPVDPRETLSTQARVYLDQMLDVMQDNSINRLTIDWASFAIAFRERPQTRSFGTAMCGLSTANGGFPLSDGAVLILTVAVMADRTKNTYGDSIIPEEVITDPDQVVQRAVAWLQSGG